MLIAHLQRTGNAFCRAPAAGGTVLPPDEMHPVYADVAVIGTNLHTFRAADAFHGIMPKHRLDGKAFWIVTPFAAQIAPCEKDGGSYARPVVQRKALYVKNYAFQAIPPFSPAAWSRGEFAFPMVSHIIAQQVHKYNWG